MLTVESEGLVDDPQDERRRRRLELSTSFGEDSRPVYVRLFNQLKGGSDLTDDIRYSIFNCSL